MQVSDFLALGALIIAIISLVNSWRISNQTKTISRETSRRILVTQCIAVHARHYEVSTLVTKAIEAVDRNLPEEAGKLSGYLKLLDRILDDVESAKKEANLPCNLSHRELEVRLTKIMEHDQMLGYIQDNRSILDSLFAKGKKLEEYGAKET